MPASEIAYQKPMLIAIGISIVLTIVGSIAHGHRQRHLRRDHGARLRRATSAGSDERDKQISRRGELVGYYVSSVGVVGAMALTMLEYDYFWIANALVPRRS